VTTYKIVYRNTGLYNLGVVTKISSCNFTLERNWIFFQDEEDTVKLAVQADEVLSIQDLGDEDVEAD
jgi:hypothetical protein